MIIRKKIKEMELQVNEVLNDAFFFFLLRMKNTVEGEEKKDIAS